MALQRSDTSWETSRDDLRSTASYFPFLTSWDAIALAETGQWRGECRDLPVRLFKILHAFRLECEKSMLRTTSDHRCLRFLSSLASRAVAACTKSSESQAWTKLLVLLLSASPYSGSQQRDSNLHFTRYTSPPSLAPTLSMPFFTKYVLVIASSLLLARHHCLSFVISFP